MITSSDSLKLVAFFYPSFVATKIFNRMFHIGAVVHLICISAV